MGVNEDGYHYFLLEEFDCSHTGKNEMRGDFLHKLDNLRYLCDFPFVITSGYRDKSHPAEKYKKEGGEHTRGIAADIRVRGGAQRRKLVEAALSMGFTGVGVAKGFVHVDVRTTTPVLWTYN